MSAKQTAVSLLTRDGELVTSGLPSFLTLPATPTDTRETNLIRQKTEADLLEEASLHLKGAAALAAQRDLFARAIPLVTETIDQLAEVREQPRDAWARSMVDGMSQDFALLSRRHAMGVLEAVDFELVNLARRSVTPPPEAKPRQRLTALGRLFYRDET